MHGRSLSRFFFSNKMILSVMGLWGIQLLLTTHFPSEFNIDHTSLDKIIHFYIRKTPIEMNGTHSGQRSTKYCHSFDDIKTQKTTDELYRFHFQSFFHYYIIFVLFISSEECEISYIILMFGFITIFGLEPPSYDR